MDSTDQRHPSWLKSCLGYLCPVPQSFLLGKLQSGEQSMTLFVVVSPRPTSMCPTSGLDSGVILVSRRHRRPLLTIDITALGVAGFASQVHTFGPEPLHLPPSRYKGFVLHVLVPPPSDADTDKTKPHKPNTFTIALKNILPERRPDGRNESVLNYETHVKFMSPGWVTVTMPFTAFKPTYRGREIEPKDPMYKPFDSGSIVEMSIMCRSNFAKQAGPYDISFESINGWLLDEPKAAPMSEKTQKPQGPSPTSLSHFVIFNPNLQADLEAGLHGDEKDDAREAAQIIYYTSNDGGSVTRDRMLRQVGLAKGLMGFAACVLLTFVTIKLAMSW
jgi:hypothetical protein